MHALGMLLYEQRQHRIFYILIVLAAMGAGAAYAVQAFLFSHIIVVFQDTGSALQAGANFSSLMLFILALGVGIFYGVIGWTSNSLSVYVGSTSRSTYFSSVLHKPIGFFDEENHSVGTLSGQLSTTTPSVVVPVGNHDMRGWHQNSMHQQPIGAIL